jgi:hypothetical protein
VDPSTSAAHCGSCANSCTLQGKSTGFFCQASSCWCTGSTQCRGGGTTGGVVACNTATGQCECGTTGNYCNHGEVCLKSGSVQVCTCNGQTACPAGQTCCYSPSGCKDVQNDAANCGACGHVCTGGTCQNGQCI